MLPDVLSWRYTGNDLHPTQKPVMAMAPLIFAFSEPHDIVLDPFAGSGTTAVAARLFGRRYIANELPRSKLRGIKPPLAYPRVPPVWRGGTRVACEP
jgi:DNA modification methylase